MTATKEKPAKTQKAKSTTDKVTIRTRVFNLLAKSKEGLTGKQIMEKLELKGIPALLKDEGVCDKPRIKRKTQEGVRGVVYELTALGRKDQAAGKVDENAAEFAGGKDWPEGR